MITQITKSDLRSLLRGPKGMVGFLLVEDTEDGRVISRYKVEGSDVNISEPHPFDPTLIFREDGIYHLVEKVVPMINERFGDDNCKRFMQLLSVLYYSFPKGEDWLDEMVSLYRLEVEATENMLALEFDRDD